MNVKYMGRDTSVPNKPATDTYQVNGVVVEANSHRGLVCYLHGQECDHTRAVQAAIDIGEVPKLEEWDRVKHWG